MTIIVSPIILTIQDNFILIGRLNHKAILTLVDVHDIVHVAFLQHLP